MEIIKRYCIKPNFVLRRIAGEYAIVPVDVESELTNAVMQPNETAAFIWQTFQLTMILFLLDLQMAGMGIAPACLV